MNPKTCCLEENVDEISVIVIFIQWMVPLQLVGKAIVPINAIRKYRPIVKKGRMLDIFGN